MIVQPEPLPHDFRDAFARAAPRTGRLARRVLFFSTIHSTNDVASSLALLGGHEGAVVIADTQTAGRGRRGRAWFSPPGAGLYVSIVLEPARSIGARDRAVGLLTLAAGVALAEGIERATGLAPSIKWPNDLIVGGRKLAGILAEGIAGPTDADGVPHIASVVLGYGINVGSASFPPELATRATSLDTELGRAIDRAALAAETVAALAARYDDLLAGRFDAILDAWHAKAPGSRGARVQWETPEGVRSGTTAGVDDIGALLVQTDGSVGNEAGSTVGRTAGSTVGRKIERLIAGEVTWAATVSDR